MSKRIDEWIRELEALKVNIETNIMVTEETLRAYNMKLFEVKRDLDLLCTSVEKGARDA
jgi:hypothetical protein